MGKDEDKDKEAKADEELCLGFARDVLYGAVLLIVFASLQWEQYKLAIAHVLSAVSLVVLKFPLTAQTHKLREYMCSISCIVCVLADVAIVLTLTCAMTNCCDGTSASPVFSPGIRVCGSNQITSSVVSASVSLATVGIGILLSIMRLFTSWRSYSNVSGWAVLVLLLVIRLYECTWLMHGGKTIKVWAVLPWVVFLAGTCMGIVWKPKKARKVPIYSMIMLVGSILGFVVGPFCVTKVVLPALITVETICFLGTLLMLFPTKEKAEKIPSTHMNVGVMPVMDAKPFLRL